MYLSGIGRDQPANSYHRSAGDRTGKTRDLPASIPLATFYRRISNEQRTEATSDPHHLSQGRASSRLVNCAEKIRSCSLK